jgi:hypothetical protein
MKRRRKRPPVTKKREKREWIDVTLSFAAGAILAAGIILIALLWADAAEARTPRTHATPKWVTCDTVKQYYAQLGSIEAAEAWGRANGYVATPAQKRQIIQCLRQAR